MFAKFESSVGGSGSGTEPPTLDSNFANIFYKQTFMLLHCMRIDKNSAAVCEYLTQFLLIYDIIFDPNHRRLDKNLTHI